MLKIACHMLLGMSLFLVLGGTSLAETEKTFWGRYIELQESRRLNREDAVAKYNYCPTGGCVLRLEGVELKPKSIRPGDNILINTSYTVLTPERVGIPVRLTREIFYQGKSLGKFTTTDSRVENGTWNKQGSYDLPAEASPGIYSLRTRVSTGYGFDEKTVQFAVEPKSR
jgi:hypothetical protein